MRFSVEPLLGRVAISVDLRFGFCARLAGLPPAVSENVCSLLPLCCLRAEPPGLGRGITLQQKTDESAKGSARATNKSDEITEERI